MREGVEQWVWVMDFRGYGRRLADLNPALALAFLVRVLPAALFVASFVVLPVVHAVPMRVHAQLRMARAGAPWRVRQLQAAWHPAVALPVNYL